MIYVLVFFNKNMYLVFYALEYSKRLFNKVFKDASDFDNFDAHITRKRYLLRNKERQLLSFVINTKCWYRVEREK